MSEAVRKSAPEPTVARAEPLADLLPPLEAAPINDNEAPALRVGERIGFQVPAGIWVAMVSCYAVFLAALLGATGGAKATFAIAISLLYVAIFFGVTRVVVRQTPNQPESPLTRGYPLQTVYGPLNRGEVTTQMLIVPAVIAAFGLGVMVVRLCFA